MVLLVNIEKGDRAAVHMSVILLALMLSLNISVTNRLFLLLFLLISYHLLSVSSPSLIDLPF